MNNFLKNIILALGLIIFSGVGIGVQAGNFVDVEHPLNTNLNNEKIFNAKNIYPGWSETKILRIRNKSATDYLNVYFNFDVSGNKLGKKIKLYVIRRKDGSYRIGGENDRWTLDKADGKNLYVDRLDPKESVQYEIKIKFDKDAGNEYQGLKVKFDTSFKVETQVVGGQVSESQSERQILRNQNRNELTGNPPSKLGEETKKEDNNEQALGAENENQCHSWSLWIWVALSILFAILSLLSTKKTKPEKIKQHFFFQLLGVVCMVLLWYLFDKCYYYKWFPIVVILIGILNHFYYQKLGNAKKH